MSTVFVTLCDQSYYSKARRTIRELQVHGKWTGDIVLLAVDFTPEPMTGVRVRCISHMNTDRLLEQWKDNPLEPMSDNRHYGKLYQWDKLQVFTPYFLQWDRVIFLDAGMRVFDTVQPLLDLDWRKKFLAPDDSDPYDNGNRFVAQLDMKANPQVVRKLLDRYGGPHLLEMRYFINCIFVFDTSLIKKIPFSQLETMMNEYPIFRCNEMGLMNLAFGVYWTPFPQRVGTKYLFGWSESNYEERPDWGTFHFIKYSTTHP